MEGTVLLLTALGALPSGSAGAQAPPRPIVLLLAAEDLGVRLGCYGALVETPHIDRLAKLGRRFERAYAQYPGGGASRASLMSGWRPPTTGVWAEPRKRLADSTPLQEHFDAHGYVTARVGRIFGGGAEPENRWDLAEDPPSPEEAARRAAQVLEQHRDAPLFLAVGLQGRPTPASYAARHPPALVSPPAPPEGGWPEVPLIATADLDPLARPRQRARPAAAPEEDRRRALAEHDAAVAFMDAQVGMILEALDRLDLWDRAIVVLLGDRPPYLGEHGSLPRTDLLFDGSLRVPLIAVAPQVVQPGAAAPHLAELVDVYPTLVELAGLPAVEGLEGVSLVPLLRDPASTVKTAAFSVAARAAGSVGRRVSTERHAFIEWPDGSEELYDLRTDPREHVNRARDPGSAGILEEMRRRLDRRDAGPKPPAPGRPGGRRPNVLLIILDDLNLRVGAYGHAVKTPHIDRLARMGRRFERAYAQIPMCTPSRASFLSGARPERLDLWTNDDVPRPGMAGTVPLQDRFRAAGYFTASVGKVWDAPDFAWDVNEHAPPPPEGKVEKPPQTGKGFESMWGPTENDDDVEPDGRRVRRVAQLIEERRDGPFFIAAGIVRPHLRWIAPRRYFDLYPPGAIPVPEEPADDTGDIPAIAVRNRAVERAGLMLGGREPGGFVKDPDLRRRATAAYYAAISFADAQVGVLLDTLDRLKLWDDTIVVLLSDNGHHLGEHGGLWRKDTLFEESVRVPLIVVAPKMKKRGVAAPDPVELLDVYLTLVDLAGLPAAEGADGTSLVPLLEDPGRRLKEAAFSFRKCATPDLAWSVRTDRYRYVVWPDGSEELYDHQADPQERVSLAHRPEHAGTVREMAALLDRGPRAAERPSRVPRYATVTSLQR